jgi:hypothetical protein
MLLLEGYISNFTCARYCFLYVEFSGSYVNQSLAGQTLVTSLHTPPSSEKEGRAASLLLRVPPPGEAGSDGGAFFSGKAFTSAAPCWRR